jgi:hypothetical protein
MVEELTAVVLSPFTLTLLVATQEKLVPLLEVRPIFSAVPLQTEAVLLLVITGVGTTVTLTV